ncbi:fluoride efflux transporter CrcB [Antrihabitans cavernicola]|uniref:Fluoride-specific ion channel FluC n=1 Tax=Antrihabitans cavernicola TaxID=2495913 RepID=A0A5A7SF76_9NOCA|nr:fluoride efflux transporter CrcB [Spelaeibacter cavernicola]KAA0024089.1 fluoride efflux transporter CrcB [Spelaeibacter cavernicola]
MSALLVFLGAMVGAPARYLVDRTVQRRHDTVFPWGTLTVNVIGSAILGGSSAAAVNPAMMSLLGVGFCGALTTYSTFGYETVRLIENRAYLYASANVLVSVASGLGAAIAAYAAMQWILA